MGDNLKSFNVSFISRYPSEDERLFIGGYYRIRVQSIRLTQTKQNFESFIAPLYYLDAMLTGVLIGFKYPKNAKGVIEHLFKYVLGQNPQPKMDKYLYETFDAFVQNKEHIIIDSFSLQRATESMCKLIMHSLVGRDDNKYKNDNDKTNLVRSELAAIFPKAKAVHIDAGSGTSQFSFSLIGFLSVLQISEWQKITIKGTWLSDLWKSPKRAFIEKEYESKNYKILFDEEEEENVLTITL